MSLLLFSSDFDRLRSPSTTSSFECSRFLWSFFSFSARSLLSPRLSALRSRLDLRLDEEFEDVDESYAPLAFPFSYIAEFDFVAFVNESSDFKRLLLFSELCRDDSDCRDDDDDEPVAFVPFGDELREWLAFVCTRFGDCVGHSSLDTELVGENSFAFFVPRVGVLGWVFGASVLGDWVVEDWPRCLDELEEDDLDPPFAVADSWLLLLLLRVDSRRLSSLLREWRLDSASRLEGLDIEPLEAAGGLDVVLLVLEARMRKKMFI